MAQKILDFARFELAAKYTPAGSSPDSTITIIAKNAIYDLDLQRQSGTLENFRLTLVEKSDTSKYIRIGIKDVASETTVNGKKQYVLNIRTSSAGNLMVGLANDDDGTDSDSNIIATNLTDLGLTSFSKESDCDLVVGTGEYAELQNLFNAGTTTNEEEAGEDFSSLRGISMDTEKLYYYDSSHTNVVGITNEAGTTGTDAEYTTYGGLSTGHVGLTSGASCYTDYILAPTTALTGALAGSGAGNVDDGDHDYKVTFSYGTHETDGGIASSSVTIADKTSNGQISLTDIPVSDNANVTSRRIYRRFNATGDYKLLTTISDNTTTTYTDNTANASLGAIVPATTDCEGLIVQTKTTTCKYIGVAESTTTIRIAPATTTVLEKASTAEAEAGTDDTKYMTPAKTKSAIDALSGTFQDDEFKLWNDNNYIATAPTTPTISEGASGSASYTTVKVKLAYKSDNGQYTEACSESNELSSVVSKKIDIPIVASTDAGCAGVGIWINIDSAGFVFYKDVANTTTTINYDGLDEAFNSALTVTVSTGGSYTNGTYDVYALYIDTSIADDMKRIGGLRRLADTTVSGEFIKVDFTADDTSTAPIGATKKTAIVKLQGADEYWIITGGYTVSTVVNASVLSSLTKANFERLLEGVSAPSTNGTKVKLDIDTVGLTDDSTLTVPDGGGTIIVESSVNFSGAVTNITVVNGKVTAVS